ncbi:MAG TPA: hypothetical protein EYG94_05025 [Campylobacterales bacterium]|nr:hypothetical protein [Campylobacterales bacterium]
MSWLSKEGSKDFTEPMVTSSAGSGVELNKDELDKETENKTTTSSDTKVQTMNLVEVEKNGLKLQLTHKLNEIDRNYKHGVLEYKEKIQAYNIEIEKLKNQIDLESENYNKEEKDILMIEHELIFENKTYDKLQVKFSQYINSIEELKNDYKDLLDETRYNITLKRKEKELFELLDDIEVSELTLLNKELEHLNMIENFEPKQLALKRVKIVLKELEMEKTYFESMGLHKVSNVQLENKSFLEEESSEIVDTVEVDSHK